MAIGRAWSKRSDHPEFVEKGFKFVHSTRLLGRKRVAVSDRMEPSNVSSPLRKQWRGTRVHMERLNCLESLPQDVLLRILSKVNHSDVKQLLVVSKFVSDTALIAKELHFDYMTPLAKRNFNEECHLGGADSEEPLNAPMQHRVTRSRIDGGKLASVAVALFLSPEVQWPKKDSTISGSAVAKERFNHRDVDIQKLYK